MAEYIDREAVFQALTDKFKAKLGSSRLPSWNDAFDAVKSVPVAADVKPLVHAHFYVDEGCAYCSNCRNNFKKAILKAVKFCPMCGAQIDGYGAHPDAGLPTPYDLLWEEGDVDA